MSGRKSKIKSALLMSVAMCLAVCFVQCSDGAHAFLARTWDSDRQCLDIVRAIDVMNGSEAIGGCAVRCLRTKTDSVVLYVSSMCDENPRSLVFVDGSDTECAKAVAAWTSKSYCGDAGP